MSSSSGNRVLLEISLDEKFARNEFGECCDRGGVRGPLGGPPLWLKPDRPPKLLLTLRLPILPERSVCALVRGPGLGDDIFSVYGTMKTINPFC